MTATPSKRTNSDVLTATLDFHDKKAVDVGCGEGHLVRLMTRHGAKAFGVECNPKQLEVAHAAKPVAGEVYYDGRAEDLPFADDSIDVAVFFNSLHHVDVDNMRQALSEAARVLKSGGILYVSEPIAEGPNFELMRPVHDETHVRAKAYEALQGAEEFGLSPKNEFTYIHPAVHSDFAQFKERLLRTNPHRADAFLSQEQALKDAFARIGVAVKDGYAFDQPMRVNLFTKV